MRNRYCAERSQGEGTIKRMLLACRTSAWMHECCDAPAKYIAGEKKSPDQTAVTLKFATYFDVVWLLVLN